MARTRTTKPAAATESKPLSSASSSSKYQLPAESGTPPKIFILPSKATPEARIVTLPNPRHSKPSRYLVCPETGIYEFTVISAPKTTPRSWLIETATEPLEKKTEEDSAELKTQVVTGAELYLATAIDPLFLVLPALSDVKAAKGSEEQKRLFLTSDDHFDKLPEESSHLSEILRWKTTRQLLERRMSEICDTVEAGDESMFRLNETKLVTVVLGKAERMVEGGLPSSMEEKFVKKALEAPILVRKRDMSSGDGVPGNSTAGSEVSTPQTESNDSQSTVATAETADSQVSQPSTAATSFSEEASTIAESVVSATEATSAVVKLQRLRVGFNFICARYIAPALAEQLEQSLTKSSESLTDFSELDDYLAKLAKLRSEAMAARSVGDYSRKHGRDEEEDEIRAEKKRKLEEEKKRKASASRGVKDLKKVNTTGMKKMSDFFKKK